MIEAVLYGFLMCYFLYDLISGIEKCYGFGNIIESHKTELMIWMLGFVSLIILMING